VDARVFKLNFWPALVLASTTTVLLGCVSDSAARYYAEERYEARPPKLVEILRSKPKRDFEVLADFQARGASPEYMQRKAAQIGADAVIVATFGGYRSRSDEWAGEDSHSGTYTRITGTAIRYKQDNRR